MEDIVSPLLSPSLTVTHTRLVQINFFHSNQSSASVKIKDGRYDFTEKILSTYLPGIFSTAIV